MLAQLYDLTDRYVGATPSVTIDIGAFEHLTIQVVNPTGTINVTGSNDGGAITGSTEGNPTTATNFTAIQVIPLATGTATTSITTAGLYRMTPIAFKYLRISGAGSTATKLIVFANKPM
jgi:hypothetical protein